MSLDPISEAIAHFIGLFEMAVEEARGRLDYAEFRLQADNREEAAALGSVGVSMQARHELTDYDPTNRYKPGQEPVVPLGAKNPIDAPYFWPIGDRAGFEAPWPLVWQGGPALTFAFAGGQFVLEPVPFPPGSTAVLSKQVTRLEDNDVVMTDGLEMDTVEQDVIDQQLDALLAIAHALDPIGARTMPENEPAIGELVEGFRQTAAETAEAGDAPGVSITQAPAGRFNNGEQVEELPELVTNLDQPDGDTPGPDWADDRDGVSHVGGGADEDTMPLTISAGGNTLINQVTAAQSWLAAPVFAVAGDAIEVDIISQINTWRDVDTIDPAFLWDASEQAATIGYNLATFETLSNPVTSATAGSGTMPEAWNITRLEGNLVFLNWFEQINMMSDNDVVTLSASGSHSMLVTGENLAYNEFSLLELGFGYDLVMVGGSVFSGNIISQMNVLFDNDVLFADGIGPASGIGTLATGGNMLWNQASITTIGTTEMRAMPQAYLDSVDALAGGDDWLASGVLGDALFAGLTGLNVLYIEGSIFDLQFLSQKNVLGDADQIGLFGAAGAPAGAWDIEAGNNDLINLASIVDAGGDQVMYLNGNHYSDALLHQAQFVSDQPLDALGQMPGLANEAVVFLADGMIEAAADDGAGTDQAVTETVHVDVMQTMLA